MRSTNQILPLLYKNRLNALSILSFPKSFVVVVVFGDAHLSCAAALLSSRVALRVVRMARKRGRRDDFDLTLCARLTIAATSSILNWNLRKCDDDIFDMRGQEHRRRASREANEPATKKPPRPSSVARTDPSPLPLFERARFLVLFSLQEKWILVGVN